MTGATGIVSVPNLLTFLRIFTFSHLKIIGKNFFHSLQFIFTWAHICTCMYSIWHWPMLQQFMEKRGKIHFVNHQSQYNMTPLFSILSRACHFWKPTTIWMVAMSSANHKFKLNVYGHPVAKSWMLGTVGNSTTIDVLIVWENLGDIWWQTPHIELHWIQINWHTTLLATHIFS